MCYHNTFVNRLTLPWPSLIEWMVPQKINNCDTVMQSNKQRTLAVLTSFALPCKHIASYPVWFHAVCCFSGKLQIRYSYHGLMQLLLLIASIHPWVHCGNILKALLYACNKRRRQGQLQTLPALVSSLGFCGLKGDTDYLTVMAVRLFYS